MIEKNRLLISESIRIIATLFILYSLNIPIFYKILIIMLLDKLDCSHMSYPFTGPLFSKNTDICKTMYYQLSDKITDSICYIILLFYILNHGGLSSNYNYLLIVLLLYRLIGTSLFIIKNNRMYLFYFPNFFLEICLGLMVIQYFPRLKRFKELILILIIPYKILVEYKLHIKES
jgi:hypothetical protein